MIEPDHQEKKGSDDLEFFAQKIQQRSSQLNQLLQYLAEQCPEHHEALESLNEITSDIEQQANLAIDSGQSLETKHASANESAQDAND